MSPIPVNVQNKYQQVNFLGILSHSPIRGYQFPIFLVFSLIFFRFLGIIGPISINPLPPLESGPSSSAAATMCPTVKPPGAPTDALDLAFCPLPFAPSVPSLPLQRLCLSRYDATESWIYSTYCFLHGQKGCHLERVWGSFFVYNRSRWVRGTCPASGRRRGHPHLAAHRTGPPPPPPRRANRFTTPQPTKKKRSNKRPSNV